MGGGERPRPGPAPGAVAGRPRRAGRRRAVHRHRRVRELSRGGRRKNDVIDAAAAASVAALAGDATPVLVEDCRRCWRCSMSGAPTWPRSRTRLVNQLHALLRDLIPGGADTDLTADRGGPALARCARPGRSRPPASSSGATWSPRSGSSTISGSSCPPRCRRRSPSTAAGCPRSTGSARSSPTRLLGRTGRASRFPTSSAFASYAGVAPVEVASADRARHRLPRGGDRQLNLALHIVALTQVRMRGSLGRAYYDRKIAEGKTHNEAMRCLKRRLADHVWRIMVADDGERRAAGPGGHAGATLTSSAAGSTPTASSSDKSLPGPATPDSTTSRSGRLTNTEEPQGRDNNV